ncbi:hypothetical protein BRADI_3g28181v3 [Brachypodium distachyon]|uniref:Uncharacterized protein n=1 Tax=Brachypodium distachyon TaxID=15368 RepID=A0A2K2CZQ6_BRADI|nr:hypothetical protein BRADI_3g28181v3 [Brachypodium distachyon]
MDFLFGGGAACRCSRDIFTIFSIAGVAYAVPFRADCKTRPLPLILTCLVDARCCACEPMPDSKHARPARHLDTRVLDGDREEAADALRERVLHDRLVLDEGEGAARGLGDGVHRRRVVVRAETERVYRRRTVAGAGVRYRRRHEAHVVITSATSAVVTVPRRGVCVLPVGEKHDAGDGVPVPAAGKHVCGDAEARADVGAAPRDEGAHGALRRGLARVRHAREADQTCRVAGEGHHGEPVGGAHVVDDEPHGLLQELQLAARHAAARVEHGHEIERRACRLASRRRGQRLGVHEHREAVAGRAPRERRALAVRLEDDQPSVGI